MSLDWRRFTFFNSIPSATLPSVSAADCAIDAARGLIFIGEESGAVNVINGSYSSNLYFAHEGTVSHIYASPFKDIFVTVGINENQPTFKVWYYNPAFIDDASKTPKCAHSRILVSNGERLGDVSCLAVHSALTYAAIGFTSGQVIVIKGDITREKHSKLVQLHSSDYPVTTLNCGDNVMFVTTTKDSQYYNIKERNPGRRHIDEKGCAPNCSTISDQGELIIATNDSILLFDSPNDSPKKTSFTSYAVSGEKFKILSCGRYVVVLLKDHTNTSSNFFKISIFSLKEKLCVFSSVFTSVHCMVHQWNSICIFSGDEELELTRLIECDVDQKLEILFQRNLFDVALSICLDHGLGEAGLADVYKRWADYLYDKGEYFQAAEKYIKTIGRLEASYVIHKLLDAQRISALTIYLEAIENGDQSTAEHRNLLISCYAKSKDEEKLRKLLESCKSGNKSQEMDGAIEVLLHAGFVEVALNFAKKFCNHELAVQILTEHNNKPSQALDYLCQLDITIQLDHLKKFGTYFIKHEEVKTIEAMKNIVKNENVILTSLVDSATRRVKFQDEKPDAERVKVNIEQLLEILEHRSDLLIAFAEFCSNSKKGSHLSSLWQRLLEIQLRQWSTETDNSALLKSENKVLKLLDDERIDHKVALVFCRQFNFQPGLIKLLTAGPVANLSDLLSVYLDAGMHREARTICTDHGYKNTDLWRKALSFWSARTENDKIVDELKAALPTANKSLPLITIMMLLKDSNAPISIIKQLVLTHLDNDSREIKKAEENISNLTQSLKKTKERTNKLLNHATIFKLSKCKLCSEDLTLPSVHFLCGHSFHKHCFTTYMENDAECPICNQENQKILQKINYQRNLVSDDSFKNQLEKSTDGFGTMIDMLSRGEIIVQRNVERKSVDGQGDGQMDQNRSQPASNKLLANRARIANDKKFGRVTSDSTNSAKRSPVDVVRQKITKQKAEEKQKQSSVRKQNDNPFEFSDSIDRQPNMEVNPFGEEPSSSDKSISSPRGDDESSLANPFNDFGSTELSLETANKPTLKQKSLSSKQNLPTGNQVSKDSTETSHNPFGKEPDEPAANPFGGPDAGNPFGDDDSEEFDESNPFG